MTRGGARARARTSGASTARTTEAYLPTPSRLKVLVTGARGQLGWDLTETLAGFDVTALDHKALDITDRDAVEGTVRAIKPAWVINAAAYNEVDKAETDRERAFAVNAEGPGHLAAAAEATGAVMIHVSTDYVFDGKKRSPYVESDEARPLSVYGQSKLEGERRVLGHGPSGCVIRTAGLYGVHGKNFVKTMRAAAASGRPLRVVDDQQVSPTWTRDLATAIRGLIETATRGVLHAANGGSCTWYEFALAIVGETAEVEPITSSELGRAARRPAYSVLGSERWAETGLSPLPDWRIALDRFLRELSRE